MADSTASPPRIAIDAMGGDLGPGEVVAGLGLALREIPALPPVQLVGREEELARHLREQGLHGHSKVAVVHASEVIEMDEKPVVAIKRKRDASMVRAIELVKTGEAGVAVSCGNTGALMACGTLRLRPMEGLERPALAAVIPNGREHFILIDGGANPEARPEHLVHNAVLGSDYCRVVLGISNPRVGLLTIGTEEGKGTERIAATHEFLKRAGPIVNYHGLIEGFQVFDSIVDVVVTDGFTGNIVLKTCESLFGILVGTLKRELKANPLRMAGAFLAKGAFRGLKRSFDPDLYGCAPLLGLRGDVLKAHGSSNRRAIASTIRVAHQITAMRMDSRIAEDISRINEIMAAPAAGS